MAGKKLQNMCSSMVCVCRHVYLVVVVVAVMCVTSSEATEVTPDASNTNYVNDNNGTESTAATEVSTAPLTTVVTCTDSQLRLAVIAYVTNSSSTPGYTPLTTDTNTTLAVTYKGICIQNCEHYHDQHTNTCAVCMMETCVNDMRREGHTMPCEEVYEMSDDVYVAPVCGDGGGLSMAVILVVALLLPLVLIALAAVAFVLVRKIRKQKRRKEEKRNDPPGIDEVTKKYNTSPSPHQPNDMQLTNTTAPAMTRGGGSGGVHGSRSGSQTSNGSAVDSGRGSADSEGTTGPSVSRHVRTGAAPHYPQKIRHRELPAEPKDDPQDLVYYNEPPVERHGSNRLQQGVHPPNHPDNSMNTSLPPYENAPQLDSDSDEQFSDYENPEQRIDKIRQRADEIVRTNTPRNRNQETLGPYYNTPLTQEEPSHGISPPPPTHPPMNPAYYNVTPTQSLERGVQPPNSDNTTTGDADTVGGPQPRDSEVISWYLSMAGSDQGRIPDVQEDEYVETNTNSLHRPATTSNHNHHMTTTQSSAVHPSSSSSSRHQDGHHGRTTPNNRPTPNGKPTPSVTDLPDDIHSDYINIGPTTFAPTTRASEFHPRAPAHDVDPQYPVGESMPDLRATPHKPKPAVSAKPAGVRNTAWNRPAGKNSRQGQQREQHRPIPEERPPQTRPAHDGDITEAVYANAAYVNA